MTVKKKKKFFLVIHPKIKNKHCSDAFRRNVRPDKSVIRSFVRSLFFDIIKIAELEHRSSGLRIENTTSFEFSTVNIILIERQIFDRCFDFNFQ